MKSAQHAIEREDEYLTEFRAVWPNGSLHWIESHGTVIRIGKTLSSDHRPINSFQPDQQNRQRKAPKPPG